MTFLKVIYRKSLHISVGLAVMLASSCTKDYAEINTDRNTIATVGDAEIPFLFSGAIESVPWSDQVAQNLFSDQYAQYFANTTAYFPSDRYT
ncbi:MAG: SusD/RagB family nutrient-binding outer membrane lipoprotein, partial [Sphingobacteriales bacterium]